MSRTFPLTLAVLSFWIAMMINNATPQATTLPPHPRLLFTRQDIPTIKQRIAAQAWAKARFDSLKSQADGWLKTEVKLPAKGGQWYHYYSCPKHGARLRTEGPTRHVCPIDGEVLTGYPYDDVVISGDHNRLASGIRTLGIVYQLTGDARYAAKAKEILLAYAAKYESYPLHNIRGEARVGGGKVGPQTLDESTWLITVVEGADCIWDTLSEEEQKKVKDDLLYPATDVIRQHKMSIHNIQCWKNSAVGLTGLLVGDMKLVDEALKAESGYFNQMAKGVSPDGAWYEGAWGYHFYTVSAVVHLTEGAFHSGINLYGDEFKRMFDAPITFAMPDMRLPAFNDSGIASVIGNAGFYEIAYARYKDERYRFVLAQSKRDSDYALLHGIPDVTQTVSLRPASQNYPASGYATLTAGQGSDATWFCLDYGPHGGGHGHPDKLGFVLFGLGQIIAPDPGTANYGVPIQGGWYRTTIAHNTLTVDEESQKPTEGKCEAFLVCSQARKPPVGNGLRAVPSAAECRFSAVTAHAGNIYDGVSFRRTAALIGAGRDAPPLLVFIDQIRADKEHTFDLAYHNIGKITAPPDAQPVEPSKKAGYSYFRDAKACTSSLGLQLTFDLDGGKQTRWAMAGGEQTTFIVGTGVGAHTEDRVPLVIARRKAIEAVYLWAVTLGAPAEMAQVTAEPVKLADGRIPATTDVAAVRVTTPTGVHVLVANPQGEKVVVGGQPVDAKIAHLTPDGDGKLQVRHAAR